MRRPSIDTNVAARTMRNLNPERKNQLFAGPERGGKSAAIACTLMETTKLNGADPQVGFTVVLSRIADHKNKRIDDLLPQP